MSIVKTLTLQNIICGKGLHKRKHFIILTSHDFTKLAVHLLTMIYLVWFNEKMVKSHAF